MRKLSLWVEGASDRRFFEWTIKPKLTQHFNVVRIEEYSGRASKVNKFLQSMSHEGFAYLFTADQDDNPCVSARREKLLAKFPALEGERIVVVGREIEAWYAAGLPDEDAPGLGLKPAGNCETKEQFLAWIGARSTTDMMTKILKQFDYQLACDRNRSFSYLDSKLRRITML